MNPSGWSRPRLVAVCLLGIAVNALIFGPALEHTLRGNNDFINIYAGTHMAFTDGMYDIQTNLRVMHEVSGCENINRLFNRPPFYALLAWPLGQLPYLAASHLWEFLIIAASVAFCFLWPGDRKTTALVCCWSFPLFHVFANGQDVAMLLVLIALAIRAMRKGQDTAAGVLFSLCSIKFHLLFLLPLLIVGQRRWKFLGAFALGGTGLFMLSFVAGGMDWPAKYLRFLLNPIGNPWPHLMPSVHGISSHLPNSGIWGAVGSIAVAILAWCAVRKGGFEYGLAAVLAGGVLVAPHVYLSDCAMTIPALLITLPLAKQAWQHHFHLFLLSPLCTIWVMLGPAWITGVALLLYATLLGVGLAVSRSPEMQVEGLADAAHS